jgi:tetratricopeptide (TPR) repeat protein
VVNRYE